MFTPVFTIKSHWCYNRSAKTKNNTQGDLKMYTQDFETLKIRHNSWNQKYEKLLQYISTTHLQNLPKEDYDDVIEFINTIHTQTDSYFEQIEKMQEEIMRLCS